MDMKLSGTRIKELRLKLSWSQEKLAEEAGLNPRTVQRAETDGSASLRTRLQLAEALRVQPEELDAADTPEEVPAQSRLPSTLKTRVSDVSVYYLIVLALVSLIYLAFQPAFLSLSVTNYSWINGQLGRPWYRVGAWWVFTFGFWLLLSGPALYYLYKRHKHLFMPYLLAFCAGLALAFFRVSGEGWDKSWREFAVAELLTGLVSVSGIALLLSLYVRRINTAMVRHGVYMCLSAYVFVWFFQDIVFYCAMVLSRTARVGFEIQSLAFLFRVAVGSLANLLQLLPLMLVVVLSLERKESGNGATSTPTTRDSRSSSSTTSQAMPEPPVTPYTSPVM